MNSTVCLQGVDSSCLAFSLEDLDVEDPRASVTWFYATVIGFRRSVDLLKTHQSVLAAFRTCLDSRWVWALFSFDWPNLKVEAEALVVLYKDALKEAVDCLSLMIDDPQFTGSRGKLIHYRNKIRNRFELTETILQGGHEDEIDKQMRASCEPHTEEPPTEESSVEDRPPRLAR